MKMRGSFRFCRSAQARPGAGGNHSAVKCGQRTCQPLSLLSLGTPAEGPGLPGPHRPPRTPRLCGPQSPVLPFLFLALAPTPTPLLCLRAYSTGKVRLGGRGAEPDVYTSALHQQWKLEKETCLCASPGAGAAAGPGLGHPAGTEAPPRPGGGCCCLEHSGCWPPGQQFRGQQGVSHPLPELIWTACGLP